MTVITIEAAPESAPTLDRGLTHPLDYTEEGLMPDPIERFWSRIEFTGFCWLWTGPTIKRRDSDSANEYGRFSVDKRTKVLAHRFAYEHLIGPVPEGMELDHLCRVRRCVNPDHLEPVTPAENSKRTVKYRTFSTHCPSGHEYTETNTRRDGRGHRYCVTCDRERQRRRYWQQKEER